MKSPIHQDQEMERHELEPGLLTWRCPISNGHWIPAPSYWTWHAQQLNSFPNHIKTAKKVENDVREPARTPSANADRPAILCPETNSLLIRYRVGGGLGFYVDRSPANGGIWLDSGEWEALKEKGIHDSLHMIFNSSYQKKLRIDEAKESLTHHFFKDLNQNDRETLENFAAWLEHQPNKRRIAAWLHQQIEPEE